MDRAGENRGSIGSDGGGTFEVARNLGGGSGDANQQAITQPVANPGATAAS